ncbi:hypothetical protein [Clostridium estertheticum]|uniref:hypothetical protein n=1 Tax=Clostridium estertheticum TaxID=238834 RepID=UPI001CF107F1|nr:hypothetical protein [Clostridium estertheticum]MCB2339095.1 hypothetical protein [Clostridium estertheticum]
MEELFQYLLSKSLGRYDNKQILFKLNDEKIMNILEKCNAIIVRNESINSSGFNYSCNNELSGKPFPCASLSCRINNVDKLSRFSALYSDSIIVENPLEKYLNNSRFTERDKMKLIDDLEIIYYMHPLLIAGLIKFSSNLIILCDECGKKLKKEENIFEEKLSKIKNVINKEFLSNVNITFTLKYGIPRLVIVGDEDYIPHGSMYCMVIREQYLSRLSELFDISSDHVLSKNEIRKLGIVEEMITDGMFDDISSQRWLGTYYNTQYVTSRQTDFKVLRQINNNDTNNLCDAVMGGITHSIPYIYNIELEQIINLRNAESDAFFIYREAIQNVIKSSKGLSEKQVKEAFDDLVRKELLKINLIVKKSHENLIRKAKREIIIGGAIITAGIFTKCISPELASITASIGGLKYLHQFCSNSAQIFDEPLDAPKNDIYFLWKVQNLK